MSKTAKSVVFDISSNHGYTGIVGVRSIEFKLAGSLITVAAGDITAYASSTYDANYGPANAFVTSLSKTGSSSGTSWATAVIAPITSRLIVVFSSPIIFDEIVVNNYHSLGGSTTAGTNGVKITISSDAISDTTYNAAVANSEVILTGTVSEHAASDAVEDELIYYAYVAVHMALSQPYALVGPVILALQQVYGVKLEMALQQVYRDADKVVAVLAQYYSDAVQLVRSIEQPYADAVVARLALQQAWSRCLQAQLVLRQTWGRGFPLQSSLVQPYHLPGTVQAVLAQVYSITDAKVQAALAQSWSIRDVEAVQRSFNQVYGLHADPVSNLIQQATVTVDNAAVVPGGGTVVLDPLSVSVEASRDAYCWTCSLQLATQQEYLACEKLAELTVVLPVGTFELFVASRKRERKHGQVIYSATGYSKSKQLDAPYADTVSGELTGLASEIAASLAAGYPLSWNTEDWHIGEGVFLASDETPISLIRKLAAAVGAVIQTDPDGTIVVEPYYPVSVNRWQDTTPDYTLTDNLDYFSSGETPDDRPGYNVYRISDQLTSAENLRLEEEGITSTSKYMRGYQTPWIGNFELVHSGGAWVDIEPLGMEEWVVEGEVVEVVAGAGNTQYPIYERIAMEWQQTNLGTVTFAEDGRLETEIEGESLLRITYRTRCLVWRVRDPRNEQLQLVVNEEL